MHRTLLKVPCIRPPLNMPKLTIHFAGTGSQEVEQNPTECRPPLAGQGEGDQANVTQNGDNVDSELRNIVVPAMKRARQEMVDERAVKRLRATAI